MVGVEDLVEDFGSAEDFALYWRAMNLLWEFSGGHASADDVRTALVREVRNVPLVGVCVGSGSVEGALVESGATASVPIMIGRPHRYRGRGSAAPLALRPLPRIRREAPGGYRTAAASSTRFAH